MRPISRTIRLVLALALLTTSLVGVFSRPAYAVSGSDIIITVAGNGGTGFSGDGGQATSAMLNSSQGVAADVVGNLYIADTENHRIRKVDAGGKITTVVGNGSAGYNGDGISATSAMLNRPYGVAVDAAGNLYIADTWNSRIRKVDSSGKITTVVGNGSAGYSGDGGPATSARLNVPFDVVVDAAGNLYINDNSRIRKVNSGGIITTVAGNGGYIYNGDGIPATSAGLNPQGMALDAAGNLYIADSSNHRIRKVDSGGIITTVVGNGSPSSIGDGGPATSAMIASPKGVAVDRAGNLYIADEWNSRIRKVDSAGIITTVAGNGSQVFNGDGIPATSATTPVPQGVAIDTIGNLYIIDIANQRIRKVVVTEIITTVAGNGGSGYNGDGILATSAMLNNPQGVAVDVAGNLYIVDIANQRIRKVDRFGKITTVAGNGGSGYNGDGILATSAMLSSPQGVAVDVAGNLYIADTYNQRIRKVDSGGIITTVAGNGGIGYNGDGISATSAMFAYPFGVAVDVAGNLYIADTFNQRIRKVNSDRIITTVAGNDSSGYNGDNIPATTATLRGPWGVAVDTAGNLYIADRNNSRIRKVSSGGIITTVAGNGGSGYNGDNIPATSAAIGPPQGVAVDTAGNLYIADTANNRIRKVNSSGIITTIAGNGSASYNGDGIPATSAMLNTPTSVAVGVRNTVYIADFANQRVRRVTANTAPVAQADSYTTAEDTALTVSATGVLANDSDANGDVLTVATVGDPSHGTLTLNSNGSFTYTPVPNYSGGDSFSYLASDAVATSNVATVMLTVNSVNHAPVAIDDSYSTNENTPLIVTTPGVLGNDSDSDGNPLTVFVKLTPAHGSLTLNPNGSFTYTPTANYSGPDSFTYRASDGSALSEIATVSLTVNAVNDAPTLDVISDRVVADTAGMQTVSLSGIGDGDPELSQTLKVTATSNNLTLIPNPSVSYSSPDATGSLSFTPVEGATGTATISVLVSDDGSNVAPNVNAVVRSFNVTVTASTVPGLSVGTVSGTYGGGMTLQATLTADGSAMAGRSVSFSLHDTPVGSATTDASGVATLSASLATINAGSYPGGVTASFAGESGVYPVIASADLSVAKATATIGMESLGVTYDGTARALSASTSPAGLSGLSLTYAGQAIPPTDAGQYTVVAHLANDNYTASDTSATLTIEKATASFTLSGLTTTYDGQPKAVGVSTTPAGLTEIHISYNGSATAPTNADSYPVTVSLDNPNYQGTASATLTIAKALATLSLSNLTQGYDGAGKAATVTTSPPDLEGVSVTYAGGTTLPVTVGHYAVRTTLDNPNYTAEAAEGELAIVAANQTISFAELADKTYGDAPFDVSASASSGLSVSFSATGDCSLVGSTVTISGAGSCTVTASQARGDNYTAAPPVERTFNIAKAHATISLADTSVTYDGAAQPVTASTTPANLSGLSLTYNGATTPPTDAGTYSVVAHLENDNYRASDVSVKLTIEKASATISMVDTSVTYDGTPQVVSASTNPANLTGLSLTYAGQDAAPTGAGEYIVVASLTNDNYTAADASATLIINKATATVHLSNASVVYDGSLHGLTGSTTPAGLTLSYSTSGTPINAGDYTVTATVDDPNYQGSVSAILTINKAPASLSLGDLAATYDGTPKAVGVSTTPAELESVSVTYNGGLTVPIDAGSYTIVAHLNNPNYSAADATGTLVISPQGQSISFAGLANKTYGDASFDVSASASSGLPVSFSATGDCSLTGSTVTISGAGSCTVTASQDGSTNYSAAAAVERTFSIAKAHATISLADTSVTYDGAAQPVTASTTPANLSGLSLTYNGATTPPTDAGTYSVVAHLENDNYRASDASATLTIEKASASFTLSRLNPTYDGTPQTVGVSTTPPGLAQIHISYNGSSTPPANAGSYPVTVSLDNPNYQGTADATLTIAKALATLSLSNLTQGYDGAGKAATVTTSPPDLEGVSVTYAGVANLPVTVGHYAVRATLTNPNYTAEAAEGELEIVAANQTISFADLADKTYGDAPFGVSATATSGLAVSFSATGTCSLTGSTVTITGAGSCTVTASQAGGGNYTAAPPVERSFSIAKAHATISMVDTTVTYDGAAQPVTASTDPADLVGLSLTYAGQDAAPTDAGTYTVVASLTNDNYRADDVSVSLTIKKAPATISMVDMTVTYNGSAQPVTASTNPAGLTGLSLTYVGQATAPTNAGSYLVVASLDNPNYTAADTSATLTINKATATVIVTDPCVVYDGSLQAPTGSTIPEGLTLRYAFIGTPINAGGYAVQAMVDDPNYEGSTTGTLTIKPAWATVSLSDASVVYDGSLHGLTGSTTPAGLSLSYSTSGTPINVGDYPITATVDDPNYQGSASATLSITLAAASLSLSDLAATYDGTPRAVKVTTTPAGVTGVSVTYDGVTTAPTDAGSYAVVAHLNNPNYQADDVSGTLVISGQPQSISFGPLADKTYGETPFTLGATASSGLPVAYSAAGACSVAGSTVTLTGAGACSITASQVGNGMYAPAAGVTQGFSIARAAQSITFDALATRPFSPTPFTLTASASSGLAVSYTASGTCSVAGNQLTMTGAGSCSVTASQAGDTNYDPAASVTRSFSITSVKLSQSISFAPLANKTYGDAPFSVSATASSGLPVSFSASGTCKVAGSTVTITGAGTCTITAAQAGNATYNAAASVTRSFSIAKASAKVTIGSLSQVYNGLPKVVSIGTNASGLSIIQVTYNGSPLPPINAGSYTVVATLYNLNYQGSASATLVIAKANQIIGFAPLADRKFSSKAFSVGALASSGLPVSFSASGACRVAGNLVTMTGKGTCSITASQAGNANFNAAASVTRTFTIK